MGFDCFFVLHYSSTSSHVHQIIPAPFADKGDVPRAE